MKAGTRRIIAEGKKLPKHVRVAAASHLKYHRKRFGQSAAKRLHKDFSRIKYTG